MTAEAFDLSMCNSSLNPGQQNNFSISFTEEIGKAYIGGGFLRINYVTSELQQEEQENHKIEYFPGIEGVINLYSSFYVPGQLQNISVYLHYFADTVNQSGNKFYLTIGNTTIYTDNNLTGGKNHTITTNNISDKINLSTLSLRTVPIRIGFENVTFGYIFEGNADVALVTDVSGSMDWRMDNDDGGTARNCDDSNYNLSSTARLSAAKCLDKSFAQDILNISGNRVGLVSYDDSTHAGETVYPTKEFSVLNSTIGTAVPETGYEGSGATCICCGINSAVDILTENVSRTVVISTGGSWYYDNNNFFSVPQNDDDGDSWFDVNYDNESDWQTGSAILGTTNGFVYSPLVVTELGDNLSGEKHYANLWEHNLDNSGPPNDFSSNILNYTANTFGLGNGDDGWDYDTEDGTGPFGYDDDIDYNEVVGGELNFDNNNGGSNTCTNNDCSGSYGLEVNITTELYDVIQNGGRATISFDYDWDGNDNPFEDTDEVWIKSYWESPTTGIHYLGAELSSSGGDTTLEIDRRDNPDDEFSGTHSEDISSWIEGSGMYYLAIGGKLYASWSDEWGTFTFDNIKIEFEEQDTNALYANLWEHNLDVSGPPNDFSGGTLNFTANTYGVGNGNDGWDWDNEDGTGQFDFDDNIDYNQIVSGVLELDSADDSSGSDNSCSNNDCSGSYGIEINITQKMYNIIQSNGVAILSFWYEWDDVSGNIFETEDQVWIKARWTSPNSGSHYLGSDLDLGQDGEDVTLEVDTTDNPDADFTGDFSQDISSFIEGPGNYYLELGGKLLASQSQEYGWWRFDNIQIKITNRTNHYYFRKHFTISNIDDVGRGVLNVLYDDSAKVYLNGNLIDSSSGSNLAEYWNSQGITVPRKYFRTGDNVVAVDLSNSDRSAKFDLELAYLNTTKEYAMMVMSDGVANRECAAQQGTGSSTQDAIEAACDARKNYGITVYSVGYSDAADEGTLQAIADCGRGIFKKSNNTRELQEFYQDVASTIVSASRHSQTIEIEGEGNIAASILYADSYIEMNYAPVVAPPQFAEISLKIEEKNFPTCNFTTYIPSDIRVTDARLTSYSSEHWTDVLKVNFNQVYNLSTYSEDYTPLGDPFIINIPVSNLVSGDNVFFVSTGDSSSNTTSCSQNNTFIYTGQFTAAVSYNDVLEKAVGCSWTVESEDGTTTLIEVPIYYSGTKDCYYTSTQIDYDQNDTYDDAMFNLLDNLDFDDNGKIFVNIEENDLVIGAIAIGKIPYPWGPAITEVRVWH